MERNITVRRDASCINSPFALSPNGRRLADIAMDNVLQMWDTKSGDLLWAVRPVWASHMLFTPDSRKIVTSGSGHLSIRETHSGRNVFTTANDGNIAISPDGRLLAVSGRPPAVWDLHSWKQKCSLSIQSGPAQDYPLAFSQDGRLLATVAENPDWQPPGLDAGGNAPTEVAYVHEMTVLIWGTRRWKALCRLPGPMSFDTLSIIQFTPNAKGITIDGKSIAIRRIISPNSRTRQRRVLGP